LHPTRWRELIPEFAAIEHLNAAREILSMAERTPSLSLVLWNVEQAIAAAHPVTRDPNAVAEMVKRLNEDTAEAPAPVADLAAENARLREELARRGSP
jgi:hypothetical protein